MISEKYGIKPDPLLDQHFLINPDTVKRIVSISDIKPNDRILEIGAGVGTLTKSLAKTKAKVIAVEMDKSFEKILRKLKFENLKIIYNDILKIIDKIKFNKIVSNTPYSICEPLINKLFRKDFELGIFSVPERFYRRISSKPGDKYFSILGLKAKAFFEIIFKFRIPREDFYPIPKTETVVVLIRPLSGEEYEKNPDEYVMKEIFLQKTRKLKNSLMEGIINLNKKIRKKDFTKNMAREIISGMKLNKNLLEKTPKHMDVKDFQKLKEKIITFL